MRTACVGLCLLATAMTASADDSRLDPAGADAKERLSGDVAVWLDAPLALSRASNAPAIKLATLNGTRAQNPGQVAPFHVVSATGDLVTIELTRSTDCAPVSATIDPSIGQLKLLVHRADLAPVIVKTFKASFADGTSIELEPGTPVVPTPAGVVVRFGADELELDVPAAYLGHSYNPHPVAKPEVGDPPKPGKLFALRGKTAVLGSRTLTVHDALLYPHIASAPVVHGGQTLFPTGVDCGSATLLVANGEIASYEVPNLPGFGTGYGMVMGGWQLPKNTPLATPDGAQVAVSADAIQVEEPKPGDTTACKAFRLVLDEIDPAAPVAARATAELSLCAPVGRVVHKDNPLLGFGTKTLATAAPGERSKDRIHAVIKRQAGAVRACYTHALDANPNLSGKVTATFTIGPAGKVTHVAATGMTDELNACVAHAFESMTFDTASIDTKVTYPFAFSPAD